MKGALGAVHILRNTKFANFWPPSPYVTKDNAWADHLKYMDSIYVKGYHNSLMVTQ